MRWVFADGSMTRHDITQERNLATEDTTPDEALPHPTGVGDARMRRTFTAGSMTHRDITRQRNLPTNDTTPDEALPHLTGEEIPA